MGGPAAERGMKTAHTEVGMAHEVVQEGDFRVARWTAAVGGETRPGEEGAIVCQRAELCSAKHMGGPAAVIDKECMRVEDATAGASDLVLDSKSARLLAAVSTNTPGHVAGVLGSVREKVHGGMVVSGQVAASGEG